MNHAQGMAWLHYNAVYRRRFGVAVPDWACTFEMSKKLRLVRAACAIGMPLAQAVLVRDEANDPGSLWGVTVKRQPSQASAPRVAPAAVPECLIFGWRRDAAGQWNLLMKRLFAIAVVNTILFTIAALIGIAIWKVLLGEIILFFIWNAWRAWSHPAQQLVAQAAHMNWRAAGTSKDEEGYRDTLLERDGVIVRVSFRKKCVFLVEPQSSGPHKDFLEVERLIAQQQSPDDPVERARAALLDIEAKNEIPGLSAAKPKVLNLLQDREKVAYLINVDKVDPRNLIYLLIHNVTLDELCTGDHHIYRGVLSMQGNLLQQAYAAASNQMTARGMQDRAEQENGMASLRKEISEIG